MLFWVLLAISVLGFGYAAYMDIKTTEFPDWLPYVIIASAVATRGVFAVLYSDWWILISSVLIGMIFLGSGLLLYHMKQWGDGDGWLFGALGFLYPNTEGMPEIAVSIIPFPITIIFNFFVLSFFYLVAYSIILGLKNRKAVHKFFKELRKDFRSIAVVTMGFASACIIFGIYVYFSLRASMFIISEILLFPVFLISLLVFMRYARFVENNMFKRKIDVKDMKPGDVPVNSKWRVMSERELEKLKKRGGKIWIKEGVRFAPVFIMTVLVTLFYGSLFLLFV